jgi:sigma54-dependent transcription regulator
LLIAWPAAVDEDGGRRLKRLGVPDPHRAEIGSRLHDRDRKLAELDLFDRAQLSAVLDVWRRCSSLSAAGRLLFAASRQAKSSSNDADRLRKYLARFGLDWARIRARDAT